MRRQRPLGAGAFVIAFMAFGAVCWLLAILLLLWTRAVFGAS